MILMRKVTKNQNFNISQASTPVSAHIGAKGCKLKLRQVPVSGEVRSSRQNCSVNLPSRQNKVHGAILSSHFSELVGPCTGRIPSRKIPKKGSDPRRCVWRSSSQVP